jgi:hypothetical protein
MKLTNWFFLAGAVAILSSCGNDSASEKTTLDSTASSSAATNTDNTSAKSVDVPPATRSNFESKYPNASNVTWTYYGEPYTAIDWEWTDWPVVDNKDYVVRYNWQGLDYYSWYDENGEWIGTTSVITDYSTLPAAVNNTISKDFNGYSITAVDKENDKNREAYEIDLEKGTDKMKVLISADGTVLKKKGAMSDEKVKEKADVK